MWDVTEQKFPFSLSFVFLLTHPVWDVTISEETLVGTITFLLTHPVWDVTMRLRHNRITLRISTHTSRVGCYGPADLP